jgi:hypothetical protein
VLHAKRETWLASHLQIAVEAFVLSPYYAPGILMNVSQPRCQPRQVQRLSSNWRNMQTWSVEEMRDLPKLGKQAAKTLRELDVFTSEAARGWVDVEERKRGGTWRKEDVEGTWRKESHLGHHAEPYEGVVPKGPSLCRVPAFLHRLLLVTSSSTTSARSTTVTLAPANPDQHGGLTSSLNVAHHKARLNQLKSLTPARKPQPTEKLQQEHTHLHRQWHSQMVNIIWGPEFVAPEGDPSPGVGCQQAIEVRWPATGHQLCSNRPTSNRSPCNWMMVVQMIPMSTFAGLSHSSDVRGGLEGKRLQDTGHEWRGASCSYEQEVLVQGGQTDDFKYRYRYI